MSFASSDPHVSSLDDSPVLGYRRISVSAVIALVLGIASALALVHPFLWTVPAAAVVVAIFALRAIANESSMLTGRGLALTGLALALVFGMWAPARTLSRQWQLYHQARVFADEWLALVHEGKLYEAHQLTVPHAERQIANADLAPIYEQSADVKAGYDRFFSERPAKTLARLGKRATYTYIGGAGISPREFITEHIALDYRVVYEEGGRERTLPIRIVLDRDQGPDQEYRWLIRAVNDPNAVE